MDAAIFLVIALVITIKNLNGNTNSISDSEVVSESVVQSDRVAKINETFYEDLNAFSEIINALGFPKE